MPRTSSCDTHSLKLSRSSPRLRNLYARQRKSTLSRRTAKVARRSGRMSLTIVAVGAIRFVFQGRLRMRVQSAAGVFTLVVAACAATIAAEPAELFNGKDFAGWKQRGGAAKYSVED